MFKSKPKQVVGLEIDSGEVRAVEISGTSSSPRLGTWGRQELPEGAVEDGIIYQPEQVAVALDQLWSTHNLKSQNVVLGIANQDVLVRFAHFPKVPEDKLDGLIRYQAQDYLPLQMENFVLDYTITGEEVHDSRPMYEVLLVAARRDMVDVFMSALSQADLEAWDIDVSSLVLKKIAPRTAFEGAAIMVDVAEGQSNILLLSGGFPRLARRVPVRLRDAARHLGVSVEEMVDKQELLEDPPQNYLDWIDALIGEIRSSVSYYQAQEEALSLDEIVISGKGARIPELVTRTEEVLDINVRKAVPFANVNKFKPGTNEEELDFSIAVSLALRGLEG